MTEVAPKLVTLKEAATYLKRSTWTLRHMVACRDLPFVQNGPHGKIYFEIADLNEWISRSKIVRN